MLGTERPDCTAPARDVPPRAGQVLDAGAIVTPDMLFREASRDYPQDVIRLLRLCAHVLKGDAEAIAALVPSTPQEAAVASTSTWLAAAEHCEKKADEWSDKGWLDGNNAALGLAQAFRENAEQDLVRQADLALVDTAARDVLAERARQISEEGWTPEHDDAHSNRELLRAAIAYSQHAILQPTGRSDPEWVSRLSLAGREWWPWDKSWWKPTTPRRDLVKAAALILAEIERLDRAAIPTGGK